MLSAHTTIDATAARPRLSTGRQPDSKAPPRCFQFLSNQTLRSVGHLACLLLLASQAAIAQPASAKSAQVQSILQQAQAALKSNQPASAAAQFRQVLALDPSNVEAHANLGVIAFVQGDCPGAEPELARALKLAPSLVKAQALLAICEKRLGQPSAQASLEASFAHLDDAKMRSQVGVELADLYYQRGDLDATAAVVRKLLQAEPDNADILFFAQRVYSELADETLNKLAVLAPDSARMQQLIAERLVNAGDAQGAIDHYRKALAINPRLPGMHFELAEAILQASPQDPKAQADAQQELLAAANTDGDSARIEAMLGGLALGRSQTADALAFYRKAYAMNPKDADAQMGLARVASLQGKPAEAASYLRMAIDQDPLNAEAHYRLAQADKQLGNAEDAKKEMRLFTEVTAAKDKAKHLYRQMNPQSAAQETGTQESGMSGGKP